MSTNTEAFCGEITCPPGGKPSSRHRLQKGRTASGHQLYDGKCPLRQIRANHVRKLEVQSRDAP
ncbi:hypothetical protein ZHAS_00020833 [Anopheles sinensis]|uniref:Uncharacterized protein n=1 Tax=Anopheles sinensis TaxID=74873 RepID=A0A084WQS1_ANOSI|nr:hypothetical protein ZHAS_00020833 [Anopheles sinensis]